MCIHLPGGKIIPFFAMSVKSLHLWLCVYIHIYYLHVYLHYCSYTKSPIDLNPMIWFPICWWSAKFYLNHPIKSWENTQTPSKSHHKKLKNSNRIAAAPWHHVGFGYHEAHEPAAEPSNFLWVLSARNGHSNFQDDGSVNWPSYINIYQRYKLEFL